MLITEEYIDTMTIVMGMIGSDGIVMSADGRATYTNNKPPEDNYRKIYPVSEAYVGYAGRGLAPLEDLLFLRDCTLFIQNKPKFFSVASYATAMATLAKMKFANKDKAEFEIGFIVAGYDRGPKGNPTTPRMYRFLSRNDYMVEDCPADKEVVYLIGQESKFKKPPAKPSTAELKNFFIKTIGENECETVGGDIRTVIIKGNNVQETIQATN